MCQYDQWPGRHVRETGSRGFEALRRAQCLGVRLLLLARRVLVEVGLVGMVDMAGLVG
jgi:hypothetical protein